MKVVSLFSGAGGFDLGLIQAGHEIIWGNDNDRDCVDTYTENIGNHIICDDISNIPSSQIPSCDVIIGGFPCQGFSHANLRRSVNDKRNKLYLEFLRVVDDKKPRYFSAENVRGILTLEKGEVIERIESDFRDAGYRVQTRLFNMADFGVPQHRQRVFISGTHNDLSEKLDFAFPDPTHAKEPVSDSHSLYNDFRLLPWVTISEALKGIPEPDDSDNSLPNHICSSYKVTNRNFTGHRRTDPNKPSPTILARGNGKGGVCAIQHPNNHRRLSIRESAIIQTFPMEFKFVGKMNSCYRQVGNAVPVLFVRLLGQKLKSLELKGGTE